MFHVAVYISIKIHGDYLLGSDKKNCTYVRNCFFLLAKNFTIINFIHMLYIKERALHAS